MLKRLDVILLFMGILVILLNYSAFHIMIISFAIWIFAVIEWINYYKFRLSYSLNPCKTLLFEHEKERIMSALQGLVSICSVFA